jgi:hypothetical protein
LLVDRGVDAEKALGGSQSGGELASGSASGSQPPGAECLDAGLLARRHFNIATVALANKTARIAWAVMVNGSSYRAAA